MSAPVFKPIDPTKIRIESINIAKAAIDATEAYIANPVVPASTKLSFTSEQQFDFDAKRMQARIRVDMIGEDESSNPLGLSGYYDMYFHFSIANMEEHVSGSGKTQQVNAQLGATIMGIAYSTMRGVVLERTAGTFFQGTILPVLDPRAFLNASVQAKP
jgi:hypothetical protein